ncbi:unnamed protein product, partial [Urochloa humidicola]
PNAFHFQFRSTHFPSSSPLSASDPVPAISPCTSPTAAAAAGSIPNPPRTAPPMAPHLHLLLLPPAALAIAAPGRRRVSFESAGPRAPPRARAASFSCAPGRVQGRLSVAAAAEDGAEPGAGEPAGAMRLNEYMVSVDRPLGVRFALGVDGRVFVHSLRKGGNAEKSRIIMVGDTLKKAGGGEQGLVTIKDLGLR